MKLFHAFPRPRHRTDSDGKVIRDPVTDIDRAKGFDILRLILTHGLLCTPEKFRLYPNYNTENLGKRKFLKANMPHEELVQSRACFTLVDTRELSQAYELSYGKVTESVTHTNLFGDFAIGLDPLEARELGIMPTVYYYRHDLGDPSNRTAGLGWQIVERLDEARTVFSVLSYLESWANNGPQDDLIYPSPEKLQEMGVRIRYQPEIESDLRKLNAEQAKLILRLFNTDRVPAWNLVDFIEILLSLYQTVDSTIADAPLAFFRQREWRLVHHMTEHLIWFGLGHHKNYRNPRQRKYAAAIEELTEFICKSRKATASNLDWLLKYCWVLTGSLDRHFRDFVREIVVPQDYVERANALVAALPFASAAPSIIPLPPRWRIITENDVPRIVLD